MATVTDKRVELRRTLDDAKAERRANIHVMKAYFPNEGMQAYNFLEKARGYGCGSYKIGTQLKIGEDIYSLLVVS